MKTKVHPPSLSQLVEAYNTLQLKRFSLVEYLRISEWARFDPRLAGILVVCLKDHWQDWNPFAIRDGLRNHPWPGVFGVLSEHVALQLNGLERKAFQNWIGLCFFGVPIQKENSLFYIGLYRFGGPFLKEEAFDSIALFSKWGFLGKSPILGVRRSGIKIRKTFLTPSQRFEKINKLFETKKRIRVQDYLAALSFQISKRTAEMDLKKWARKVGNTKGAYYLSMKSPRASV